MKKILLMLFILLFILIIMFLSINNFTKNQDNEVTRIINQLNPLINEEKSYLKIGKPDEVFQNNDAIYSQSVYDKNGEKTILTYSTPKVLKEGRYLEIKHKRNYVITYSEIAKENIPSEALKEIESESP